MSEIWQVTVLVLRAPFTHRARLDLRFCATGAIVGVAGFAVVAAVLMLGLAMSVSIVGAILGLPLIVAAFGIARRLGALHRRMLSLTTGEHVAAPTPTPASTPTPPRSGSGALARWGDGLRDSGGWRAVAYVGGKLPVAIAEGYAVAAVAIGLVDCTYPLLWVLFRNHPVGSGTHTLRAAAPVAHGHWVVQTWPGTVITALVGATCVFIGVWLARGATMLDARLMRSLFGPSRVNELERSRAFAVEDAAAALRRVERDLHDGAQVRLAAVAMNLGLAQEKAGDGALRELLEDAQAGVSGALADLRRIARGIHPPSLDSGLAEALASLAATSPIPVRVSADLPERPSRAIETIAYFCAAELLANAIKHSSAGLIEIVVINAERPGVLRLRVIDDGKGGASVSQGSGLAGLAQRAATVDGTLEVSSPRGGPTMVTVELPMHIRAGGDRCVS
jgi:signal transduction histidine kinase